MATIHISFQLNSNIIEICKILFKKYDKKCSNDDKIKLKVSTCSYNRL